jgi:hypothetical protein
MHAASLDRRPRRRMKIWKIVILAILAGALLEPIVMYTHLQKQRAHREASRSPVEVVTAGSTGN